MQKQPRSGDGTFGKKKSTFAHSKRVRVDDALNDWINAQPNAADWMRSAFQEKAEREGMSSSYEDKRSSEGSG